MAKQYCRKKKREEWKASGIEWLDAAESNDHQGAEIESSTAESKEEERQRLCYLSEQR